MTTTELALPKVWRETGIELNISRIQKAYEQKGFVLRNDERMSDWSRKPLGAGNYVLINEADYPNPVIVHIEDAAWKPLSRPDFTAMRARADGLVSHVRDGDTPIFHLALLSVKEVQFPMLASDMAGDERNHVFMSRYDTNNNVAEFVYRRNK